MKKTKKEKLEPYKSSLLTYLNLDFWLIGCLDEYYKDRPQVVQGVEAFATRQYNIELKELYYHQYKKEFLKKRKNATT